MTNVEHPRAPSESRAHDAAVALHERIDDAFDHELNGAFARRLSKASTTVTFLVDGSERDAVTVLLDRRPPELAPLGERGEITIELSVSQAERFARGELVLATALLEGELVARGPVRKYLSKDPILRSMLAGR